MYYYSRPQSNGILCTVNIHVYSDCMVTAQLCVATADLQDVELPSIYARLLCYVSSLVENK